MTQKRENAGLVSGYLPAGKSPPRAIYAVRPWGARYLTPAEIEQRRAERAEWHRQHREAA